MMPWHNRREHNRFPAFKQNPPDQQTPTAGPAQPMDPRGRLQMIGDQLGRSRGFGNFNRQGLVGLMNRYGQ